MTVYEIKGKYIQHGKEKKFAMKAKANSHSFASDKVMCLLGSQHKIKRRQIIIEDVNELEGENGGKKGSQT